jgi:hypothetical protein
MLAAGQRGCRGLSGAPSAGGPTARFVTGRRESCARGLRRALLLPQVETGTANPAEAQLPASLGEVLNTARAALDQEFQIAQLLDAKARGLVTLAGQWFAIAQAVAAVAFATHKPHTWMLWAVGISALVGAVAVGFLFVFSWNVWKIRDEPAVSPRGLLQMRDVAEHDPSATKLIDHYAALLRDRRATNKARADALADAQAAWFFAMGLPFIELGFAVATRLFA